MSIVEKIDIVKKTDTAGDYSLISKFPEYSLKDRLFDGCILDNLVYKLSRIFLIETSEINQIADLSESMAEKKFGNAKFVIRYMAAVEYINLIYGIGINSLDAVAGFYDRHKENFSETFFDLLCCVEQRQPVINPADEARAIARQALFEHYSAENYAEKAGASTHIKKDYLPFMRISKN